MTTGLYSGVVLSLVAALCAIDVLYVLRREQMQPGLQTSAAELLRTVAASVIGLWAFARLPVKFGAESATEPVHLFLHTGLLILALSLLAEHMQRNKRHGGKR